MTTLQTALTVATAATTSGTLAAGRHTPVDASSGALTMTLPTPATIGARLRVEKTDAGSNVVTVSGTIRGGASTISLAWQYESVELFAESLTSWRVAAGHKTKAALDAAYASLNTTQTQQTGAAYTLALADAGTVVEFTNSATVTATVPANSTAAFPIGTTLVVRQYGTGQVTLTGANGVTLRSRGAALTLVGQYSEASVTKRAVDEWVVSGDVTA